MDLHTVTDLVPAPGAGWLPGDAFLAGGTWLFSEPQPEVSRLLDLQAFDWPSLVTDDGGLEIAATCTLAELARWSPPPQWHAGGLVRQCCAALLGSFKVWNAATVGGNICLSLPAGPMTSLASALDGVCTLWAPDGAVRTVPAVGFVTGPGRNVLANAELLRSIRLPAAALRDRAAFRQISLSPSGRSAAVIIGRRSDDGATVVTVTASTPRPVQLRFDRAPTAPDAVAALGAAVRAYYDDVHGEPRWRAAMTRRFVAEVVDELGA